MKFKLNPIIEYEIASNTDIDVFCDRISSLQRKSSIVFFRKVSKKYHCKKCDENTAKIFAHTDGMDSFAPIAIINFPKDKKPLKVTIRLHKIIQLLINLEFWPTVGILIYSIYAFFENIYGIEWVLVSVALVASPFAGIAFSFKPKLKFYRNDINHALRPHYNPRKKYKILCAFFEKYCDQDWRYKYDGKIENCLIAFKGNESEKTIQSMRLEFEKSLKDEDICDYDEFVMDLGGFYSDGNSKNTRLKLEKIFIEILN